MKLTEAAALLTVCAAYDERKPDADKAKAWSLALEGLRFEDCRDAIVTHYRSSGVRIMPADVRDAVKRIRAKRIAEHPPVIPPPDCADDRAWLADMNRRIGDGETFDPDQFRGELKARDMKALAAGIDSTAAVRNLRSQIRDRHDRGPSKPTDPEHARRKAQALAELDAIRMNTPAAESAEQEESA